MSFWEAFKYIIPRLPKALWVMLRTPYFIPTIIRIARAQDDENSSGHLAVLEETVKRHPKDRVFRSELIRTYYSSGDHQKALEHAQIAVSCLKKSGPQVYYYMAACHYHLGDQDSCKINLREFLNRVKKRHRVSLKEEIRWAETTFRHYEEESNDQFQLREALEPFENHAFKAAVPLFETAYLQHGNSSCLYYLGRCHSELGDYSKALEYVKKYLAELDDIGREVHSVGTKWAEDYIDWYSEHYGASDQ